MRRDRARLRPWLLALAAAVVLIAGGADALASGSACAFQPGGLPDAMCTPGAIDPRVTQDNIHETICRAGYTSRARWTADDQLLWPTDAGYQQAPALRPPTSYTNGLKGQGLVDYGAAASVAEARPLRSGYEEDHLISLEIGGAPRDPANLWPEPWTGADNARQKDVTENLCHAEVCNEHIALADAQQQIAE